ncbi:hypothetical protein BKA70DRAFT_1573365 [Coprinopsis sp. MPI-PUGE-AT-0042]|nr:hypothetical protein BKA70DRAFT_1573365 [Coprinopsis sp. MPI-PUGE-AT-0042]
MSTEALIPTEIVLEIFQRSLPNRLDKDGRLAFQTIRSVCSRWRSISFSSRVLWSSIAVVHDSGSPSPDGVCSYDGFPAILEGWFSRAGPSIPLELDYGDSSALQSGRNAALARLVQRHHSRWKYLCLCVSPECFWDVILSSPSTDWNNLQILTLWIFDFHDLTPAQCSQRLDALENFTSLRRLYLNDYSVHTHKRPYGPFTLPELHIQLDDIFAPHHMHLISAYTSLTRLVLEGCVDYKLRLSPENHLSLPSLLDLSYTGYDLTFLQYLTASSLTTLDIHLDPGIEHPGDRCRILSQFLKRCTNTLHSILLDSGFSTLAIAGILPALLVRPSVTHLTLDAWPSDLEMDASPAHAENDWCPNLQELTVSFQSGDNVELERMAALAAFLRRRKDSGYTELEMLTIRKGAGAAQFPYDLFENVRLGKLRVMIPW